MENAEARKSMIKTKPSEPAVGEIVKVSLMTTHPMYTGLTKDEKTGQIVPPHFINDVEFFWGDKLITKINSWETISANPLYEISLKVDGDNVIKAVMKDNKGEVITCTKNIKVKA